MTEVIGTRPAVTPEIVELVERPAAVVGIEGRVNEWQGLLGEAFAVTAQAIGASGAVVAGPPFTRYHGFGERVQAEAGFPFAGPLAETDRVRRIMLPGGRAVTTTHVGPYDEIGATWERVTAWMGEHELVANGPAWESYLTGPDEPGQPVTEIFWPID
jgi:effector-binding domain-containing protein